MWVCHTLFLAGLPFGRVIGWIGQMRETTPSPWSAALRQAVAAHGAWALLLSRSSPFSHPAALALCVRAAGRRPCARDPALRCHLVATARHAPWLAWASAACRRRPRRRRRCGWLAAVAGRGDGLERHAAGLRTARGVLRSLRIYYGHPASARAMDALYAQFVRPRRPRVRYRRPCRRPRSPSFRRLARGSSRSSRSRRCTGCCSCSLAATLP